MAAPTAAQVEALIAQVIPRYRWTADKVVEDLVGKLVGKNIIVTGATSGIGIPTAVALARTGCNLFFTARDTARGASTLAKIKEETKNENVQCLPLDLASYQSVLDFVKSWGDQKVDVLLHNAGVMASPFTKTSDGEDQQQQVNFLSVILLTEKLRAQLADDARVVIVSSSAHKRLGDTGNNGAFLDIFKQYCEVQSESTYEKWTSYCVAKSAALMYSNQLNAEFVAEGKGRRSNALHPGGIMTGLQKDVSKEEMQAMGWLDAEGNVNSAFKNVEEGASTSVWAAVSPELAGIGGNYLENCAITPKDCFSAASNDVSAQLVARLMGTAPHVWKEDDFKAVTEIGRAHLVAKKLL